MVQTSSISINEDGIKNIIAQDDKDEFATFLETSQVKKSGESVKLKFGEFELCSYKLLAWICYYRAVRCCTALVEGKTGLKLDFNVPMNQGAFPLHEAASSLCAPLIELFLRHGAQADVLCNSLDSEQNGMLPLQVAIESVVRYNKNLIQWNHRKSVFKLIIILCLPEMKEALEAIRLLAWNTEMIKEVSRYYAKNFKVIELAILLMVAGDKVVYANVPIEKKKIKGLHGFISLEWLMYVQSIGLELVAPIIEFRVRSSIYEGSDKKLVQMIEDWNIAVESIRLVIAYYECAGGAIQAYCQSEGSKAPIKQFAQKVGRLLRKNGSSLTSKDTDLSDIVDCCPTELVSESSRAPLLGKKKSEQKSKKEDVSMPLYPHSGASKMSYSVPNEYWRLSQTRIVRGSSVLSSAGPLRGSTVLSSAGPLHSFWNEKASFTSGCPKAMQVQVRENFIWKRQYASSASPIKQWVSIAYVVKRGIRRCL